MLHPEWTSPRTSAMQTTGQEPEGAPRSSGSPGRAQPRLGHQLPSNPDFRSRSVSSAGKETALALDKNTGLRELKVIGDKFRVRHGVVVDEDQQRCARHPGTQVADSRLAKARVPPAGHDTRRSGSSGASRRPLPPSPASIRRLRRSPPDRPRTAPAATATPAATPRASCRC